MSTPPNFGNESSPDGAYYNFSPDAARTFANPSPASLSVNSSPGVVYIGDSSPDNPIHKNRSTCPTIGRNNGTPRVSDKDGSVECSYDFKDFQNTSDLQEYVDAFGPDDGFHETMREYCQRPSEWCSDGESKTGRTSRGCTNMKASGSAGKDCRMWASQYPDEAKHFGKDYSSDESGSDSSHHYSKHYDNPSDNTSENGGGFWMILVIIILIVIIAWIFIDYKKRYQGGHPLGGMGKKK